MQNAEDKPDALEEIRTLFTPLRRELSRGVDEINAQIMASSKPQWTQDEAIAFECAREAITDMMGILTRQIVVETFKEIPNADLVARLRSERSVLAQERAALHITDRDNIARIREVYGPRIRAYRESIKAEYDYGC